MMILKAEQEDRAFFYVSLGSCRKKPKSDSASDCTLTI